MSEDPQIPAPETDNLEPTAPAPADNAQDKVSALEAKILEQSRHLAGSKAEALRLKQEADAYKEELEAVKAAVPAEDDVELFKQYAKKAGIVTKEEIEEIKRSAYKSEQDAELANFLEKYPEYKPENDPSNEKWGQLISELATYKAPVNAKDWGKLLTKAHKIIAPDNTLEKGKAIGMAQANLKEQASLGQGNASSPKKKLTPEQQSIREGFKAARPDYFKD